METFLVLMKFSGPVGDAQSMQAGMGKVQQGAQAIGVQISGWYMTMGRFDSVALIQAPNSEAAAKFAMLVGSTGFRTETLRAFSAEQAMAMMGM